MRIPTIRLNSIIAGDLAQSNLNLHFNTSGLQSKQDMLFYIHLSSDTSLYNLFREIK